jgi:hypothetical protein
MMKYQDLKIRDAGRLAAIGLALAVIAALCIVERQVVESFLGRRYIGSVGGLVISGPLCLAGSVWYLLTSPPQNARFVRWANRKRKTPITVDWTLFDKTDPDYQVITINYLWKRLRGGRP